MVFDGGVPEIKRQTVQARARKRVDEAEQVRLVVGPAVVAAVGWWRGSWVVVCCAE